jgi:hypothetical protein
MVRPEGFEPPTLWFVAKCSIQLSYGRTLRGMQPSKDIGISGPEQPAHPTAAALRKMCGAPGEIRTPDPLVRSQMLYPAELRAHENSVEQRKTVRDSEEQ